MLLAIDAGNTHSKAAVFEHTALLQKFVFDKTGAAENIEKIFSQYPNIMAVIYASVNFDDPALLSWLQNRARLLVVSHTSRFPFVNNYTTPLTLGIDRMVLSAGAVLQYPGRNRLVIDCGTCITYDFTDSNNVYHGGAISPGLQMRYKALHTFTAKLPLLLPQAPAHYTGNATNQAIHSGVVNGLLHEIEGFIKQYEGEYANVAVILTGGDTDFLANRVKNTIFANSNFLLESLNYLYLYNNKND